MCRKNGVNKPIHSRSKIKTLFFQLFTCVSSWLCSHIAIVKLSFIYINLYLFQDIGKMIICLYIAFSSTNDFLLSISKRFSLWEYTFLPIILPLLPLSEFYLSNVNSLKKIIELQDNFIWVQYMIYEFFLRILIDQVLVNMIHKFYRGYYVNRTSRTKQIW